MAGVEAGPARRALASLAAATLVLAAACDTLADRRELERDDDPRDRFNEQLDDRVDSFDLGG